MIVGKRMIAICCFFIIFITNSNLALLLNEYNDWINYKSFFGQHYTNALEDSLRKEIFEINKSKVESFNLEQAAQVGYNLSINHLSSWTEDELIMLHGSRLFQQEDEYEQLFQLNKLLERYNLTDLPDSVDWTKVSGRVTHVKDQGYCGSCWAFATTGALEGQMEAGLFPKKLKSLSEQNLVDCSSSNHGCSGGTSNEAMKDIKALKGIQNSGSYEYEALDGKCRFDKSRVAFTDNGSIKLPKGDEQKLKEVVATFGPVAVSIDASSFRFHHYNAGIYYNINCKKERHELDHAVLIVGYSSDPVYGDYWIVKNSWSEKWGEKGYIRMARNRNNHCGIATAPIIPIIKDDE